MQHAILTLIRHAETTGNLNRLLQGITDSPVTVFGQAQIDALARTWSTTLPISPSGKGKEAIPKLDLPPSTLIACSPIGRARKTAEAVHRACTPNPDDSAGIFEDAIKDGDSSRLNLALDYSQRPGLPLIVDPGLMEKDFGWKESTRGGVHIAGYPKGHGSGESRTDFHSRVTSVGSEWLNAAASLASTWSDSSTAPPHIVLVSHGMWINAFLSAHPPTTISQTSGQPGFLPFAANTGMFSLKVQGRSEDVEGKKVVTDLFRANDIRHLANVKRQKGGIGRGAFDSKQQKLSSFFTKPQSPAKSVDVEEDKVEIEASPSKKRKT